MIRSLLSLTVPVCAVMTMFAAPAAAQSGPFYVATPETPPARTTLMTRETIWHVSGASYVTARQPERAAILCELVARSAGRLSSFTVGGQAFDTDKLARCNAAVR